MRGSTRHSVRVVEVIALATCLALTLLAPSASAASKEIVSYFGTELSTGSLGGEFNVPGDIAVNQSGAGPADADDIYVIDTNNQRIQRFDAEGNFISAWGADVSSPAGGSDYEVCEAAASCKAGVPSGGNGTAAGNGTFSTPSALAVDQDTGNLYVSDGDNRRVNVYDGAGTFLRSFGWDVVASGPGESGTGYEVCVAADGDVCKAGVSGAGVGQINLSFGIAVSQPDGAPASGTVYVADRENKRVDTYGLDGLGPASFGSEAEFGSAGAFHVAVDSRGIVYVEKGSQPDQWTIARYDSEDADGGGVGFLAPIAIPPLTSGSGWQYNGGLEVDPDSDGPGPDTDVLFAMRGRNAGQGGTVIQQFGPVNEPGLSSPPTAADEIHGAASQINFAVGLGLVESSGRLLAATQYKLGSPNGAGPNGVYVLDVPLPQPTAVLDSVDGITATAADVHATIDPNGPPDVSYHLEYSTDGSLWGSSDEVVVGSQEDPQELSATLDPPGGLEPATLYHVRVVVKRPNYAAVISNEETFTTLEAPPQAETTGSPLRTATTTRLEGRVGPRNSATTYRFEYGSEGPCDANPCTATPAHAVGSDGLVRLVAQDVSGLQPATTYHYRVIGESAAPGSPSFGEDMTVRTRADDEPLEHGHLPGPPGSDRAYELVSPPDTSGNPVVLTTSVAIADDGNRATYGVAGGTSQSDSGSVFNQFFAERTSAGWKSEAIFPKRDELVGTNWYPARGRSDLSELVGFNFSATGGGRGTYRLAPGREAVKLFTLPYSQVRSYWLVSDDAARVLMVLDGALDPEHPAPGRFNLYDVSSGSPKLLSLLAGEVPACGVEGSSGSSENVFTYGPGNAAAAKHWISADGSRVIFPARGANCGVPFQLYAREIDAEATKLISGPVLSGPTCAALFLKSTADAAFFWTRNRLDPSDTVASGCEGGDSGDVYRYEFASEALTCMTCIPAPGVDIGTGLPSGGALGTTTLLGGDGSRLYFTSPNRLTAGAATPGLYRMNLASREIAYVAPASGIDLGDDPSNGAAINRDGSVLVFSSSSPELASLGGSDNHGVRQYYRYDDRDRSLVCVSCAPDGSAGNAVPTQLQVSPAIGRNSTPLDVAGDFVFQTYDALVAADQNTDEEAPVRGSDIYEWRDGRLILVTDGLLNWAGGSGVGPTIAGITPSGRDVFFTAPAQYTADALDAYPRYYDARIGGGFAIPRAAKPCPLEVCQGIPNGAPEERGAGSASFVGPGNAIERRRTRCPKGKHRVRRGKKVRCVRRRGKRRTAKHRRGHHRRSRANRNRRANR